jgi:hypothetical protein
MNRINSILLLILLTNGLIAQQLSIPPRQVYISFNKTVSLVFPQIIASVDRGTSDLLVQKVMGMENILQLKAAKEDFSETNMTVITADGKLYSFLVNYKADPADLNIQLNNQPSVFEKIAIKKRFLSGPKDSKYEMLFRLSGVYIEKNIIYYQLELQNRSNISYDVDMLRFFIRDKQQSKRTASQELEQFPLYVYGNTGSVEGQSKKIIVVALPKFTIPDKKLLYIQLTEKNGGRNLQLKIRNRNIIEATQIQ